VLSVKRLLAAAAALLLLLAPGAAARPTGGTLVAFVSAEDDDELVAVQPITGEVLRRLAVANGPHNVAAAPDGRSVLVTSPPAGRVTLVDARMRRVVKVFGGFGSPHDVEVAPDSRYAYVTDEHGGRLPSSV
jgi:DNA-binding beta-propeller fold protein YncE